MSQAKIDEALWFESLLVAEPARAADAPQPQSPRRWFRFLRAARA